MQVQRQSAGIYSLDSVSYTHLERCGISGAGYTSSPFSVLQSDTDLRNKIMPATNKTAIMPTPALMFPVICDTRPVSYTHLDVYKRQGNCL